MKKSVTAAILLVFYMSLCSVVCGQDPDKSAEADENSAGIISAINDKADSINTFKANVITTVTKGAEKTVTEAKIIFEKPGRSNMQGSTSAFINGTLVRKDIEQAIISNGEILWHYIPAMRMAAKVSLNANGSPPIGNELAAPFYGLDKNSLVFIGMDIADDQVCYVIEGERKDFVRPFKKMYFNVRTNLLCKQISRDIASTNVEEITYKGVDINVPVSDEDFTFVVPAGVQVREAR